MPLISLEVSFLKLMFENYNELENIIPANHSGYSDGTMIPGVHHTLPKRMSFGALEFKYLNIGCNISVSRVLEVAIALITAFMSSTD